jgi:calcineurin-like phosphoesterase family protein
VISLPLNAARTRRPSRRAAGILALALSGPLLANGVATADPDTSGAGWDGAAYRGGVHVVEGPDEDQSTVDGTVFVDRDRDSRQDRNERGLGGVTVSNGREVTTTDRRGRYELPASANMTVFVTQPRGYQVPVDEDNVAQFFYHHLPAGSPRLRYGGLQPTGPLPDAVNFPLVKSGLTQSSEQHCAIGADPQTYNQAEVGYARKGAFADLARRSDYEGCGALFIGDIVGDDLSLFPQTRELTSMLNGPARFLPGNHDLDFDSPAREHNFDTFRAHLGPEYFSYDAGKAHVVALSTIEYPTKVPPTKSSYTYGLGERQLAWLRNDIAAVPKDRVIVLASHSPLLEFYYSPSHRTKQLAEIYQLLEGREVVAVAGHTHMSENLREGDLVAGWKDVLGEEGLPFTHLTVGAMSGHWYAGRLLEAGYPTAIQRDGTPPGVLTLDIQDTDVVERYQVRGADESDQMSLGLNTPRYRAWYNENASKAGTAPVFQDPLTVGPSELAATWLTTNFWMGSTGSTVVVSIDGRPAVAAERTQPMQGEPLRIGAEWSDPVANQETRPHGGGLVDRTMHLWRLPLPADLTAGQHVAEVTATDVHGRSYTERLTFEVTR